MKIEIIYEDDDLVIVNKPAGVLVIPDRFDNDLPSLNRILETKYGHHMYVVHRLDRGTSGVICFAKNEETHKYMSAIFQEHKVEKYYLGLVGGRLIPESGTIEAAIMEHPTKKGKMVTTKKGKPSRTDYTAIEQWPLYSLVQFRIFTGRTHQIRVHMQSIGHPIACDELYGDGKPFYLSAIKKKYNAGKDGEEKPLMSRLALHASKLVFTNAAGKEIVAEAPLPKDIAACVNQLNKWAKPV
ncbi:MAG: RluA family pseudouridine synthase [Chitinophagaceae bacterium]|nr:RluA family pseudouridine synthase [Chitinophagaceae bacterium]MCB9047578.1 RluA family pseudouridine synthase [Chitinophagales bacterium]